MTEIWKSIDGYENYQVSNLGRVRSLNFKHTGTVRVLKPCHDRYGYLYVNLCKNGKYKSFKLHRLVAQAFLENPKNLPQVNHRNEIKTDNRLDNLEFCDAEYNNNYGTRIQRTSKRVLQFSKSGEFLKEFPSIRGAERETGINHGRIIEVCQGKLKSAGGFVWLYR